MKKFDTVSIGSATLDIVLRSSQFLPHDVSGTQLLCEVYGGKTDVEDGVLTSGGSATNTAVAFARQGLKSTLVTEVGQDAAAQIIFDDLSRELVDTSYCVEEPAEHTAISVILTADDASRSALTYRGAAHMLTSSDIDWDMIAQCGWIHIGSLGNAELVRELFIFAKTHDIPVSWNPNTSDLTDVVQRSGQSFLKHCVCICINDQEYEHVKTAQKQLEQMARYFIVTKGKNGGSVWCNGVETIYESKSVTAVCEIGAGDAFVSGFVSGLLHGKELKQAIELGSQNAASVVQYIGAKKGLLRKTL